MNKGKKLSRTWIETKLSFKERERLIFALLKISRNPTGRQIQKTARELFPERKDIPSIESFNIWKMHCWGEILNQMDAAAMENFNAESASFQKTKTIKQG